MKYKVLHVVLSMETGGLENGIVNLVNNADHNQFSVDILCLREKGTLAQRIKNPNSQVTFDGNQDPGLFTAIKKIYKACIDGQYHIVHSHGFTTMLASYIATRLARTKIMMNGEHGTLYYSSAKQRILQRFLFKKMDINLTVSRELKRKIHKVFNFSLENFKPIINGVDTDKFNHKLPVSLLEELCLKNDSFIIGSVGRLVAVKNYPSLIKAFAITHNKHPKTHLVIAGEGPERVDLESLITELNIADHVHLLGNRDDVANIMNAIDIFVLPSFSEGLSNTLLEAMSCGTPVIASDVGGNPEIIKTNITGFLYPSNDIQALSHILTDLCEDSSLVETLSKQAREHIVDNYSLQSMVDNYEATYAELILKNNLST
jgi:sugar transferase (PEP-CTERM/EpsH1 system associated)